MMNRLEAAARQALEALEMWLPMTATYFNTKEKAIIALREALAEQAAEPVALGPLARRRVFDYIRGAYDLGYSDARNAKAVPGDGAPGYKGRDVEADHGGALLHALEALGAQPTQQAADHVLVPLSVLEAAVASLATFIGDQGWSDQDMQNMDNLSAYIAQHKSAHGITGSKT